ncbi:MAG: hypothetical protein Kow0031_21920 [Anaerolineae bacterium]
MTTPLPRLARTIPDGYDPGRRLLAAIVVCAVRDVFAPAANVTWDDRMTAQLFLQQNADLVADLAGVSIPQVKEVLASVPAAPIQLPLIEV